MRRYLMVSITNRGQAHWFEEWIGLNRACIASVCKTSRLISTDIGDTYHWVILGPQVQGTEPDAVFLDDRMGSRLTAEQYHWLEVLHTRVRPRVAPRVKKPPAD